MQFTSDASLYEYFIRFDEPYHMLNVYQIIINRTCMVYITLFVTIDYRTCCTPTSMYTGLLFIIHDACRSSVTMHCHYQFVYAGLDVYQWIPVCDVTSHLNQLYVSYAHQSSTMCHHCHRLTFCMPFAMFMFHISHCWTFNTPFSCPSRLLCTLRHNTFVPLVCFTALCSFHCMLQPQQSRQASATHKHWKASSA